MGLDMYLRAKTNVREYKGATGACSGLFNLAPTDDGMFEIGYWRKAYDQQDLICNSIDSYDGANDNCHAMIITKEEVEDILNSAKEILKTHTFNEDGEDESTEWTTWNSEEKWKDTIKFFEEAEEIMQEDPTAEIYYVQWY